MKLVVANKSHAWAEGGLQSQFFPTRKEIEGFIPSRTHPTMVGGDLFLWRLVFVVTFDVDGPDRQRKPIDALLNGPLSKPIPGLIASHFRISLDGSRVLSWAQWSHEAAHEDFMQTSLQDEGTAPGFVDSLT
jgi:hypothetical protein